MKRGLSLTLIFCMCISFSSFAAEITDIAIYKDTENGYTYFFGKFSEDLEGLQDVGFKIEGKYFSLNKPDINNSLKTGFEIASKNDNVFGIGIKNLDKAFGSEFNVTPYIETDKGIELMNESIPFTTYNKNPQILSAYSVKKLKPGYYAPYSSSFDEITNFENKYKLTTLKDTDNIYSSQEILLKYDISDFCGIGENNKASLTINVLSIKKSTCVGGKIKVLTVESEDYGKDKAYYHDVSSEILSANTLTGTADRTGVNLFDTFTFDVTKIINDKIRNNESTVTFVIQLNNDKERSGAYVSLQKDYGPKLTIE